MQKNRVWRNLFSLLVFTSFFLPSCGGGGGGSANLANANTNNNNDDNSSGGPSAPAGDDGPFLSAGTGFGAATAQPPDVINPSLPANAERAIARWSTVPYDTISTDWNVGVVADHYNEIAKVEFSVDDGPWVATTQRRINPQSLVPEFYATMKIADFADGLHEIRAKVFPVAGVPRVLGGSISSASVATGNHSLFISTNRDASLLSKIVWVANDGNDTTGNGSEAKPFLTLHRAGHALANDVFQGDAGGGIMYLKAGSYNLGTYLFSQTFTCPTRYITIQPAPGVARENVKIVSSSQDGLRTDLIRFYNLTLSPASGAVYPIRNLNNHGIGWFDHCYFTAQNFDDSSSLEWYLGWKARIFTDCSSYYTRGTPYNGLLVRNSTLDYCADDAFKNIAVILNCSAKDLSPHGTPHHPDVWQVWNQNGVVQNCYVDNLVATDTISAQGLFFHGFTFLFLDCAFRNVTIDNSNNGQGTVFVNLHMHRPVQHLLIRNSLLVGGGLYRTGDDPSTPATSHNIFSALNMLMENVYKDNVKTFVIPPPDGPSLGNPGSWPGTLPWLSPLGVYYREVSGN